jgi:uncharacterized protein (TIGR02145 family)
MKFNRPSLRPLATFAASLVVLVACQNATDSNSGNSGPMKAIATIPFSDTVRIPDSTAWSTATDSGHGGFSCTGTTCHDTLSLKDPLGSQVVNIQLWILGIHLETLHFTQSGSNPNLIALDTFHIDSLGLKLLESFDSLRSIKGDSLAKAGPLASDLIAYYSSLLLAGITTFKGFPSTLPAGLNPSTVQDTLVLLALQAGKSPVQLASLSLGLDTGSIRTMAGILVKANLLKTSDTLVWFHPVRVSGAVSLAGSLTAGGAAVGVTGTFAWNAGTQVSQSSISVHGSQGVDNKDFQFPTNQFHVGSTDTSWNLSGNLTVQALASAPVGWDTLVITLSSDPTHLATALAPFQVVAKDNTPPTLILLSPAQDTVTAPNSTSSFVVKAVATDSGSGVDSLKIGTKTYRTTATVADTLLDTLSLVVGANVTTVQAWDHAGNTSSATVTITRAPAPVNTKAPTVIHVSPLQDTESVPWATKSAALSWTITGDTTIVSVTLNGHPITGSAASAGLYQTTAPLNVGLNIFPLAAVDAYGLAAYDTLRITRQGDTSHPVVVRGASTDDTVLVKSQTSYSPVWTVTDNALDSVTVNGIAATAGSGNTYSAPVTLSGDSLWIPLVAVDSSGNTTRDSIKVRRLALVGISGAGTSYSGSQTPTATLSSNLPGARIGYSSDKVNWTPYPVGGITISKNQILYAQDTVGAMVSGIDSGAFLYIPTPTLSGITGTQATVTIAPAGSAGIEDSLSTGTTWTPYSSSFSIRGSTKVFARSHLGAFATTEQEVDFAQAPTLTPSAKDTGVDSVVVSVSGPGADSVQVSLNQLKWFTVSGSTPSYVMTASGTLYGRSWVGSALSAVDSVSVSLYPSSPRFSEVGGAYLAPQTVSLATVPAGSGIYYTTDGSTPTTKSTAYTKPISVGTTMTLKAIAANGSAVNGLVDSILYAIADTNSYGIPWNSAITYGTLWDTRDNQVYRTVKIGSQTWMASNLNYAGTASTIGVCANDNLDSCAKNGRQYTWTEALALPISDTATLLNVADTTDRSDWTHSARQGICPVGWHVPSGADWDTLLTSIQSTNSNCATTLNSLSGWPNSIYGPSGDGTDAVGFRILPSNPEYWFSSESQSNTAWYRYFTSQGTCPIQEFEPKSVQISVRCIHN